MDVTSGLLASILLMACAGVSAASEPATVSQRFEAFDRFDRASFELDERARARAIADKFDTLFGESRFSTDALSRTTDGDLDLLFRAAFTAAFYSFDPKYVTTQVRIEEVLEKRGKATQQHLEDTYGSLVQVRRLEEAREFQAKHAKALPPLPPMRADAAMHHSRWVIGADHQTLIQAPLDTHGTTIVVMAHPLCHFTRNAVESMSQDPELRRLFAQHATLVVPPERDFNVALVSEWNAQHPEFAMSFLDRRDEWSMFPAFATPTFYFIRDGKVVRTVEGWPREGKKAEILSAAKEIGLPDGG